MRLPRALVAALLCLATPQAFAKLDLSKASVERLENGLTLILLEDRTFPVVSIQTVYRTGAKDDPAGRLGLAHFFEHMAFRGSKNFPDTGLVSEIYAAGGEWHGYTWIDLTTYFATTPKENLALLLDIEADRMARLDIRAEDVEAERGAVLAEMNGYLNDPDATLFDAVIATHFLTHPYRNNTIGYAGDINAISHADLEDFYHRHYAPGNAIVAIVGDFDRDATRKAAAKKFGKIRARANWRDPLTAEMPRTGERRIRLSLPSDEKLFKIAYPAPAASSDDFAAFLVLQALVGNSAGVNFSQNDWGTPVGDSSPVADVAENVRTWNIPTADPYLFIISGASRSNADEHKIEQAFQNALDLLARGNISHSVFAAARARVIDALTFDLETTEDAAHQLAYFAAIGAFPRLLTLEDDIRAVTSEHIATVAQTYLRENQRTIGWLVPGGRALFPAAAPNAPPLAERPGGKGHDNPAEAPTVIDNAAGVRMLFRRSQLSRAISVKAVLAGRFDCDICAIDLPAHGMTTVSASAASADAGGAFKSVASSIGNAKAMPDAIPSSADPLTRLDEIFAASVAARSAGSSPLILSASGDIDPSAAEQLAGSYFDFGKIEAEKPTDYLPPSGDIDFTVDAAKAQAAAGYIVAAPGAGDPKALATRIALYILSHGYEGRLGKEAISRRGLAYYIDAQYRAGPDGGLVTLAAGVDPDKIGEFRTLMKREVARLAAEPPTDAEIAEAKRHLSGRKISAAQSNSELVDAMILDWLAAGGPELPSAFARKLEKVSRDEVLAAAGELATGAIVTIGVGGVE